MMRQVREEQPLIQLREVSKVYRMGEVTVPSLRAATLDIAAGEFVAILGPSGSGKSTLLHILGLLDAEYEGEYFLGGRNVSGLSADELALIRNRQIGFVFQAFNLLPELTILDNVALPALYTGDRSREACRDAARQRLEQLGLGKRLSHRPAELSGGQRQCAAIARALINNPSLLLADEPTGSLDTRTAREILGLDILRGLHHQGMTIVLVTHQHEVAALAEREIHVLDGAIRQAA